MTRSIAACCLVVLVVMHVVAGRAFSELQDLKELLENNAAPFYASNELELEERDDGASDKSFYGGPEGSPFAVRSSEPGNSALAVKHGVLARLFKDLARTSKRSWGRYKKGGMRSCFGVRLDRIGSFSGLGC